jgi:nucleoside-diphosphate-sugar epimerase
MKVMVTGAAGYIGNKLAHALANKGCIVHAFVRSKRSEKIFHHQNIRVFYGDLLNTTSICNAMDGCDQVYHTAGLVRLWANDPSQFYLHNVTGTENILNAALALHVKKLVYTSSCGVWASSILHPLTETDPRTNAFNNDYDLSKFLAEKLVKEYSYKGLFTVIVNPPRVYGPGLMRHSNAVNRFLNYVLRSRIVFVPGNKNAESNYAFIDDVINGHILAMQKGLAGERYILGGENASYEKLVHVAQRVGNFKNVLITLPKSLATLFSWVELIRGRVTRHDPICIPSIVERMFVSKTLDSSKAIKQLGYNVTPLEKGIHITIEYLNEQYGKEKQ